MPDNTIVINNSKFLSWYVGDSNMEDLIYYLDEIGFQDGLLYNGKRLGYDITVQDSPEPIIWDEYNRTINCEKYKYFLTLDKFEEDIIAGTLKPINNYKECLEKIRQIQKR